MIIRRVDPISLSRVKGPDLNRKQGNDYTIYRQGVFQ